MEKKFKDAKEKYQSVEVPIQLKEIVDEAIQSNISGRYKKMKINRRIVAVAASLVIACGAFVVGLNSSEAFAQNMSDIPVLGGIARLLTFVDYEIHSDVIDGDIKVPAVEGLSDKELEKKVNDEINKKIEERVAEAITRAEEYREAQLDTGGSEEDLQKVEVNVDYELKLANEEILSFTILSYESLASAYTETFYYNINIKDGTSITLQDMLGENYKQIIDDSVATQIEERKKDPNSVFFEGNMGFTGINEDQKFYINEEGKVVVVFAKYEIAPGSQGPQEFIID